MPHNPQELALLSLLKQEQERNNTVPPTPVQASGLLPDLDPALFLSGSAQRELRAAQGAASFPVIQGAQANQEFEISASGWDIQAQDLEPTTALAGDESLERLFMAQAMLETGGHVEPSTAQREAYAIDFDSSDLPAGGRGVPNERVRFQVGRQDPPYEPFRSQRSSSDGEVVGSFRGGRFQPTVSRQEAVARATPVRAPQAASRPARTAPEGPAMSRLDRLLAPSPLD